MRRNKKGGLTDGIFLVLALFALAVIYLFSYVMFSQINTEMQNSDIISAQAKTNANSIMDRYASLFDNIFLFILVGLGIAVVAGAWFIPSHPALFWFSIPVMAFIIWISGLYANIFTEIKNNAEVVTYAADMPITIFVFQNYVIIITVYILLLSLALYAKRSVGSE